MSHRLNNFDGGVFPSDSANTPNAVVERDNNGDIWVNGVNVSTYIKLAQAFFAPPKNYTTNATLDATALFVTADASGGAFTLTLPPAATSTGQAYFICKNDSSANLVTLKGNGTENINAANTYTGLAAQNNAVIIFCTGTKWIVFAAH